VDTVIILMGTGRIREIAEELVQGGRDAETPVAIITRAYMENSSIIITNLGEIINGKVTAKNPSVIVIGEVVKKGEEAMRITNPRSSTQGSRGTRY
jgi:siroheme synthase